MIGAILGGAQFALGAANALFGQDNSEAANQAFQNTFQNAMIRYNNQKTEDNYKLALANARDQMGLNYEAANRAWMSEQVRLNEIYYKAAFQHQGMMKQLIDAQGSNNAREVYGASARRANLVSTLGEYGRTRAQMTESLISASQQTMRNMKTLQADLESQQRQTWGKAAVAPTLQAEIPTFAAPAPNPMATALKIGGAALSAIETGYKYTAPGKSFLGIKKPEQTATLVSAPPPKGS